MSALTKAFTWGPPESLAGDGGGDQVQWTNKVTSKYLFLAQTRCSVSACRKCGGARCVPTHSQLKIEHKDVT